MNSIETWTCPTCTTALNTEYCSACGERRPHPAELTLAALFMQALDAFTSYDSRLIQSLRKLLGAPGSLTRLYLEGSRKPYIGPFALFVLANVLFVAMEALTGSNAFATPLAMHLSAQPWDWYAQQLVPPRLTELNTTMEMFAPLFDEEVAQNAKTFIFLMVLPFALMPALVFAGKRLPFAAHLAFSLHFHAFMLILISAVLVIPFVDALSGGQGLRSQMEDDVISSALLLVCALYLYLASGRVYLVAGFERVWKTGLLLLAGMLVFFGYRFLLFIFTLYTTVPA